MMAELSAKRLQLLKQAIPRLTRVAVLWNPDTPFHAKVVEDLKAVAPSLAIELRSWACERPSSSILPSWLSAERKRGADVIGDPLFFAQRATLLKLASKARLPGIYGARQFVDAGGLMSYGTDLGDLFRRMAGYVDKILKGANPGDLPIEQPTKFELAVNLKTAKALGLNIPESILRQADEVIR